MQLFWHCNTVTVTQSSYTKTVVITETISPAVTTYHPSSTLEVGEGVKTLEVGEPAKVLEVGEPAHTLEVGECSHILQVGERPASLSQGTVSYSDFSESSGTETADSFFI